jgi:gas vesicle protein
MNIYSKIGIAFLAGATAGAIAGILLAPDKGTETRRKMGNKAREFSDALKEKTNEGWQFVNNSKDKVAKEFVD